MKRTTYNIHVLGPVGDDSKRFFTAARSEIEPPRSGSRADDNSVDNYIQSTLWSDGIPLQYTVFHPISLNAYTLNTRWACPHAFIIVYNAHDADSFSRAMNGIVRFVAEQLATIGSDGLRCVGVLVANRRNDHQPHGITMAHARDIAIANNLLFYELNSATETRTARAIVHAVVRCCNDAFSAGSVDATPSPPPPRSAPIDSGADGCQLPSTALITVPARVVYTAAKVCINGTVGCLCAVLTTTLFGAFALGSLATSACATIDSTSNIAMPDASMAQLVQDFQHAKMDTRRASEVARQRTADDSAQRARARQIEQNTRVYLEYY